MKLSDRILRHKELIARLMQELEQLKAELRQREQDCIDRTVEAHTAEAENGSLRQLHTAQMEENERLKDLLMCIEQDGVESWKAEIDALKEGE